MRKVTLLIVLLVFIQSSNIYSWGEKGHQLIGKLGIERLPKEMNGFKSFKEYVALHSPDPDNRKKNDKTEGPKHFIDIDYYQEFLNGNIPFFYSQDSLRKNYHDTTITDNGLLPWTTVDTYNKLVSALKEKNKEKVLLYMSDLSHYVADGHQPMHSVLNYDGKMTGQKGLHGRYEIEMLDRNIAPLEKLTSDYKLSKVKNLHEFIFSYIVDCNLNSSAVFEADNIANKVAGARKGDKYYEVLWFRTAKLTIKQVNDAADHLAQLYYSAWIDAGKPAFNKIK